MTGTEWKKNHGLIEVIVGISLWILLGYLNSMNRVLFHIIVEIACVAVAVCMFIISINIYKFSSNYYAIFLGVTYGVIGVLDFIHTITHRGLSIISSSTFNNSTQAWIAGRYLEAVSILIASIILIYGFRVKLRVINSSYFTIMVFLILSIFYWKVFPVCYVEGVGLTKFKIVSEYIVSYILMITGIFIIVKKEKIHKKTFIYALLYVISTVLSEICFTLFYDVQDISVFVGHMLKLVSYYSLYRSIAETCLVEPYNNQNDLYEQLRMKAQELEKINIRLQEENEKRINTINELRVKDRIIETSLNAIVFTDVEGRILYTNQSFLKLWGYESLREIKGRDSTIIWENKEYVDWIRNILNTKGNWYGEIIGIKKDNSTFETEMYANAIYDESGKVIYRAASIIDISERKKAERELKESEEYDLIKTQFFSNISHELKTPLNIILGGVQLLDRLQKESDQENSQSLKNQKYIAMMRQNCYRLLRLINNLIDITRFDAGFLKMNFKNHNIIAIVENISLSVAEYVKSKGLTLVFDTETEEKIIRCDADKIERVILNLLSNAIKYSTIGGIIEVNIYDRGNIIVISVKDSGVGIPENMMEVIFERFRQVDSSLSKKAEGSGIGLSLVKAIVQAHGGTIFVKSKYGEGSEFIFELPDIILEEEYTCEETAASAQSNVERISVEFSDIYS